jgi:hypothetical protein
LVVWWAALLLAPVLSSFPYPLAFNLGVVLLLAGAGAGVAALAGGWWRSAAAGAGAGAAFVVSGFVLGAIGRGTPDTLLGVAPLALALGAGCAAVAWGRDEDGPPRRVGQRALAGMAGAFAGAAAVGGAGVEAGLGLALVGVAGAWEGAPVLRVALHALAGALLVAAGPATYAWSHGATLVPDTGGVALSGAEVLRDIGVRPALVLLAGLGVALGPARRTWLPLGWLVVGALGAPILVPLAVALLAGGGVAEGAAWGWARVGPAGAGRPALGGARALVELVAAAVGAILVTGEAVALDARLPVPMASVDAARVAALADGAGPVLVLPGRSRLTLFEGGEERLAWDPRAVLLQPLHGRPIVLADHPPDDAGAPDAVGRVVAYPEVAAALACESPGGRLKTKLVRPDQPEDGGADVRTTVDPGVLGAFGVTVYVDRERGAAVGDAYLPCVAAALGGAPVPAGPYDRYAL